MNKPTRLLPQVRLVSTLATVVLGCLLLLHGCSNTSGSGGGGGNLFGFVFGTHELGLADVAVGGVRTNSRGRFGASSSGPVLVVGGSTGHASMAVPLDTAGGSLRLDRPVFLPPIEAGLQSGIIVNTAGVQQLDSDNMPGVMVELQPFTMSNHQLLRVLPLAPDMLPAHLPQGLATRCAYLVDPHDLELSPPADLTLPNLDSLDAGSSAGLFRLDLDSGQFMQVGTMVVDAGAETLTAPDVLDKGGLYAVVPISAPVSTRVQGRVISPSGTPVEGYTVVLPGSFVARTDIDGRFDVDGIPVHDGPIMLRILNAPTFGDEFLSRGPFSAQVGGITDVGNLSVLAAPRDIISPTVTYSPVDGAGNVNENSAITVTFSEPIDLGSFGIELASLSGSVPGATSFSGDGQVVTFRPIDPLDNAETFTILIDLATSDLASNPVDSDDTFSKFTTRTNAGTPPTDIKLFGLDRLEAEVGSSITLLGQNFTGANFVTIGGTTATTTTQTESTIEAVVPLDLEAGSRTVQVDGTGNLSLKIFPTLASIDPVMGSQAGGDTVTLAGGGFGSSPTVSFSGNQAAVLSAQSDTIVVVVPANTRSGPVVVTVGGLRSRDRFYFARARP